MFRKISKEEITNRVYEEQSSILAKMDFEGETYVSYHTEVRYDENGKLFNRNYPEKAANVIDVEKQWKRVGLYMEEKGCENWYELYKVTANDGEIINIFCWDC